MSAKLGSRGATVAFGLGLSCAAAAGCGTTNPAAVGGAIAATAAVDIAANAIAAAATRSAGGTVPNNEDHAAGPKPVDFEHARAVLLETDVSPCWPAAGGPHGAALIQVTFLRNGTVARVGVPRPATGPMLDATCAAEKLKDVIIDPFAGDDAIITVRYGEP